MRNNYVTIKVMRNNYVTNVIRVNIHLNLTVEILHQSIDTRSTSKMSEAASDPRAFSTLWRFCRPNVSSANAPPNPVVLLCTRSTQNIVS